MTRSSVELPSYRVRAVHLVAVWAYGVSQPVFSLLEGNPEFLAVRGLTRTGVIVFGLSLVLVTPLVAVALEWLVARLSGVGGNVLHVVFLLLFLIPVGLQVAKLVEPRTPDTAMLIVWATCLGGVTAYVLLRLVRLFVSFALVPPIIGLITFVSTVPVTVDDAEAAAIRTASDPAAIVMVVLDELPVSSLMTRRGEIDAVRYPNFARLVHDGTWFIGTRPPSTTSRRRPFRRSSPERCQARTSSRPTVTILGTSSRFWARPTSSVFTRAGLGCARLHSAHAASEPRSVRPTTSTKTSASPSSTKSCRTR